MKVEVLLFASLRDLAEADRITVELAEDAKVTDLIACIGDQHPALKDGASLARIAIDDRFSNSDDPILPGAELALIPPVSGG